MQYLAILILTILKIIAIIVPLLIAVAYFTYSERKILGYMHCRIGPNRVGPRGLLQPIADGIKLVLKEIVFPTNSSTFLYILAPALSFGVALAAWAVIPFDDGVVLADINIGILYILAMSSLGVYGIIISGWASNSRYAFLGALRAAAQVVSYEIAMGFALIGVLMIAGSTNLTEIVNKQGGGFWHWYFIPLFPLFIVHWVSAVAETNRTPFDLAEGESELVAGYQVEYAGISFGLFFLAEYANMILMSLLASLLYLGGWNSPFENMTMLGDLFSFVPGIAWLLLKTAFFAFLYLWFRATFPRYRYDQLMRLGWKVFLPVTIIWIFVLAFIVKLRIGPWF